jgi:hypothetical protein
MECLWGFPDPNYSMVVYWACLIGSYQNACLWNDVCWTQKEGAVWLDTRWWDSFNLLEVQTPVDIETIQ